MEMRIRIILRDDETLTFFGDYDQETIETALNYNKQCIHLDNTFIMKDFIKYIKLDNVN